MGDTVYTSLKSRVEAGLLYLEKNCNSEEGFQNTKIGDSRDNLNTAFHPLENFTTITALDLLGGLFSDDTKANILQFLLPILGHGLYSSRSMYKFEKLTPDDIELTGIFMSTLLRDGVLENNQQMLDVARLLILNTNDRGIMQVYLPPRGFRTERIDAGSCCHAMRLLYILGLDGEADITENYVWKHLESREYLKGTRYYFIPETFLLYLACAVSYSPRAKVKFQDLIYDEVKSRLCSTKLPLDISMRILTLDAIGFLHREDIKHEISKEKFTLEAMQRDEGQFPDDSLYKKGRSDVYFGGPVISTIMAVAALNCFSN